MRTRPAAADSGNKNLRHCPPLPISPADKHMGASAMPSDEGYATTGELARAIGQLTASDFAKLARVAQLRTRGVPELDWQDLLQEAVRRSLAGTRRWPQDVPLLHFLAGVMRSLASDQMRRRVAEAAVSFSDPDHEVTLASLPSAGQTPEESAIERDLLARLSDLFAEDRDALTVIGGLKQGLSPAEIQTAAGLDQVGYDSTRRRIRRKLAETNLVGEE